MASPRAFGRPHLPDYIDDAMGNDCYVIALSIFLRVSYWEAFVLIHGGPPPAPVQDPELEIDVALFWTRMRELGFVHTSLDYKRAKTPRLLLVHWGGSWATAHAVVWDPWTRSRVDPAGHDTTAKHKGVVFGAWRLPENVARPVTGVTHDLKRPDDDPQVEIERAKLNRVHQETLDRSVRREVRAIANGTATEAEVFERNAAIGGFAAALRRGLAAHAQEVEANRRLREELIAARRRVAEAFPGARLYDDVMLLGA